MVRCATIIQYSFISVAREAWRKLSPMTKEESMMKYIQLVETLDPATNEETVANQVYYI